MTVDEVVFNLAAKFPRAPIQAWAGNYRSALGSHEGETLGRAYRLTLDGWTESTAPKPAHIAEHLPKPAAASPGTTKQAFEARDEQRTKRFRELVAVWRRELAGWFKTANEEGWAGPLDSHLSRLAHTVSHSEIDGRQSATAALAWANGRDKRPGYPLRAPDEIVDEIDAAIFRARAASQARVRNRRVAPAIASHAADRQDAMRRRITVALERLQSAAGG